MHARTCFFCIQKSTLFTYFVMSSGSEEAFVWFEGALALAVVLALVSFCNSKGDNSLNKRGNFTSERPKNEKKEMRRWQKRRWRREGGEDTMVSPFVSVFSEGLSTN